MIDRSIDPRGKIFEEPLIAESSDERNTFTEILCDIGIKWYDITMLEPFSEEYFSERGEDSRKTKFCTLPYSLKQDREKLMTALKYVSCFSYYCGCDEDGNKDIDEAAFCSSVLDCLADIMTADFTILSQQRVMYHQVFDKVNKVIREGSLYDFIYNFRDHWEDVLKKTDISHKRKYMKSCVWNFLNDYDIEKYTAGPY